MKKKVLIILDDLFTGGALTLNSHLFRVLSQKANYDFYLLCGIYSYQQHLLKHFSFCKKIYTYSMKSSKNQLGNFVFIALNTRRLILKILAKQKFDSVIFNFPFSSIGVILSGKIKRESVISLFHGAIFLEKESLLWHSQLSKLQTIRFKAVKFFYRLIQKIMLSYGQVICFSQYSKHLLKKAFNIVTKVHVLSMPCFESKLDLVNKEKFKEKLGFSKKTFILLVASRIEPRKGIHLVAQAASYLPTKDQIKILIVAPVLSNAIYYFKEIYEQLELLNTNMVFFKNGISFDVLQNYYLAADMVIMPSLDLETFGMVSLESLSLGIPLIGFPVAATKEILSKIDNRLLAKKINAESLAHVIKWYLHLSTKERKKMNKRCSSFVKQFYNPEKTIKGFKQLVK